MSVRTNIVANYAGQAATALLNLAFVPVYIAYLSIEAYALVGLFAVVQMWLTLLDLGMTPTLSREMARYTSGAVSPQMINNLLRTVELICGCIAACIMLAIAGSASWAANHWLRGGALPAASIAQALTIMGVVVGLRFCEGIYRSALIGLELQLWFNLVNVALAALRSIGAILVLARVSPTIEAFFLWQGAVSALGLAVLAIKLHRSLPRPPMRPRFSLDALREVRSFAGGMVGIALLSLLLTQVDKLLLSRLLPLDQFGYYMLAATVTGTLYLLVTPVTQAVYPQLVRLAAGEGTPELATTYHAAAQLVTALLAPAVALLIAYPHALLYTWTADPVLAASTAPLVALLAIGTFCNGLMYIPHQLQLAHGWTALSLRSNLVAVTTLVPALLWTVPERGPAAAAVIWATLNIAYLTLQIPLMHRRLLRGEMGRWYLRDIVLPLLGSLAVVLPATLIRPDGPGNRLELFGLLLLLGGASLAGSVLAAPATRGRLLFFVRSHRAGRPAR